MEFIAHGIDWSLEGLWYYTGNVKDGSPYYDFQNSGTQFLYFDEECGIGLTPRWVVDNDKPDINRDSNLDSYSSNGEQCFLSGYYEISNNNIDAILTAAGLDNTSIIKLTVFLTDLEGFGHVNDAFKRYFGDVDFPARSTVEVSGLPLGAMVEIECIASR